MIHPLFRFRNRLPHGARSQAHCARKIGCAVSTWCLVERGGTPSDKFVLDFAAAFHLKEEDAAKIAKGDGK